MESNFIRDEFLSHINTVNLALNLENEIKEAALMLVSCINSGNKILLCGNGGSAADCQHFAAELVGRYKRNRKALSCIALTTDTSALSAIGNDFGFEFIFSRQVEALAKKGDVLIAISTSGKSKNIINALLEAKKADCKIIGLSGNGGGEMTKYCDLNLIVPSDLTPRIQEIHLLIEHIICDILERNANYEIL